MTHEEVMEMMDKMELPYASLREKHRNRPLQFFCIRTAVTFLLMGECILRSVN